MVLAAEMNPSYFYGGTTTWPPDSSLTRTIARYEYDGRGRRVARQDGATGSWTYLVSDASGNLLSELALVGGQGGQPAFRVR
jgi:YD repeat-containing protein